mmetsp:Transcript_32718/g.33060  ORF Transcript_32718/g.33060 Transcript_32718/m.33060 type:complete len:208 (+) Transcript_32718:779-1402(+)
MIGHLLLTSLDSLQNSKRNLQRLPLLSTIPLAHGTRINRTVIRPHIRPDHLILRLLILIVHVPQNLEGAFGLVVISTAGPSVDHRSVRVNIQCQVRVFVGGGEVLGVVQQFLGFLGRHRIKPGTFGPRLDNNHVTRTTRPKIVIPRFFVQLLPLFQKRFRFRRTRRFGEHVTPAFDPSVHDTHEGRDIGFAIGVAPSDVVIGEHLFQ